MDETTARATKPGESGNSLGGGIPGNGRIPLENLANTRDLGGMATVDGRCVKPKHLIRSGMLTKATDNDVSLLRDDYGVGKVIDLRNEEERSASPDPIEAFIGVEFVDIPLLNTESLGITRTSDIDRMEGFLEVLACNPVQLMIDIYPKMITDDASRRGFSAFFDEVLAEESGAVLWHCTVGKDRAGLATVLLLSVLGVPQRTIDEDYLATNRYMQDSTQEILSVFAAYNLPDQIRDAIRVLNSADIRFLQAAYDAIDEEFGGLQPFISRELGVDKDKAEALRMKYLAAG